MALLAGCALLLAAVWALGVADSINREVGIPGNPSIEGYVQPACGTPLAPCTPYVEPDDPERAA